MEDHPDIAYSITNRAKAIDSIPIKIIAQEERLLSKIQRSKKNPTGKLVALYDFMYELTSSFSHLTPCKIGCSYCCNIRVDVSELELSLIKNKASKAFKRANRNNHIGEPCPFLEDDSCSVYEVRPFQCRKHNVFTPTNELCANDSQLGAQLLKFTEVEASYSAILTESTSKPPKDIREYFRDDDIRIFKGNTTNE